MDQWDSGLIAQQGTNDFAGHGQAEDRRDVGGAAENDPAVPAVPELLCAVGTDAVVGAARGVLLGRLVFLGRIDRLDPAADAAPAQFLAHDARQAACAGREEVADNNAGRIDLVRRPHRGNDRDSLLLAALQEIELGGDVVDAVEDVIVAALQQFAGVFLRIKLLDRFDRDGRIDRPAALGHDHGLALANGAIEGMQLAVDVGQADGVEIDQGQPADAGAGQSLDSIAAHAAETEDRDGGPGQAVQCVCADQEFHAAEAVLFHPLVLNFLAKE